MSPSHSHAQLYTQPTFVELFTPKLVTVFREGYRWRDLRADAVSGLTGHRVAFIGRGRGRHDRSPTSIKL
jgi:hypothetical protein